MIILAQCETIGQSCLRLSGPRGLSGRSMTRTCARRRVFSPLEVPAVLRVPARLAEWVDQSSVQVSDRLSLTLPELPELPEAGNKPLFLSVRACVLLYMGTDPLGKPSCKAHASWSGFRARGFCEPCKMSLRALTGTPVGTGGVAAALSRQIRQVRVEGVPE